MTSTPTTHASTLSEAIQTAKPIRGTRYALGSFLPTVGTSARPRPIYVLTLDGVEVDRGSKADLTQCAKSAPGSPLGECHARYDVVRAGRILRAERDTTPEVPELTNHLPADIAYSIYQTHRRNGLFEPPAGMNFLVAEGPEVTIFIGSKKYRFTVEEVG
jgi:hypothetical protein